MTTRPAPPLLHNLLVFGRLLRRAGIPVSLDQTLGFLAALEWIDLGRRDEVFHAARSLLVSRREDLALFEQLFDRFWSRLAGRESGKGQPRPEAPRLRPTGERRLQEVSFMARRAAPRDPEVEIADRRGTASDLEVLRGKEFVEMSPEELAAVRRLIQEMRWRLSERRTRRRVPDRRGPRLHLRRVLRDAARHGGAALELARLRRKIKQRPLVLLADISGSMESYSRLILQFFYSASHSLKQTEAFVFGTRLTRITPQLRLRNIDRALDEAAREIRDWSGGTLIGESLGEFNRRWGRRVLRRGAVVVVVSDGWERGDPRLLAREMRHLRHRCHRLIWLNPHLGDPRYQPLVAGMAAALPFVDDFLPVHNLDSLFALAEALEKLPRGRRGAPPRGLGRPSAVVDSSF